MSLIRNPRPSCRRVKSHGAGIESQELQREMGHGEDVAESNPTERELKDALVLAGDLLYAYVAESNPTERELKDNYTTRIYR